MPSALARKPSNVTVLSGRAAAAEVNRFNPTGTFQSLSFWNELSATQRDSLISEGNQLSAAILMHGMSGLARGIHLREIQKVLKHLPSSYGAFRAVVRRFSFSERSAYRYINQAEIALATLNEAIIRAGLTRGMNLPGDYAQAIEALPPPRALGNAIIDGDKANMYLDKLEEKRREIKANNRKGITVPVKTMQNRIHEVKADPEFLLMQSYRLAKNSMHQQPSKQRVKFLESLVGMLMTEIGVSNKTFQAHAIPENFRRGRGRPSLVS